MTHSFIKPVLKLQFISVFQKHGYQIKLILNLRLNYCRYIYKLGILVGPIKYSNFMIRSLTSNQYVIRNGKLEIKSKASTSQPKNQPIKVTIKQSQQSEQRPIVPQTNEGATDVSKSNYRYIPYQHTVRKLSLKNYYDTTIAKQKIQIEDLKQKYKELMSDYHNNTCNSMEKQNLQRIQEALLFNQPSRVKRIYDLSKSQIMIQPFTMGIQTNQKPNKQSIWEGTPVRSIMKQSQIFQSEVICGRQVINKKQYLTPKLITRSIIMRNPEEQEQHCQSRHLENPVNYKEQQQKLKAIQINLLQTQRNNTSRKFSKNTERRKTRTTEQSIELTTQNRRSNSILIQGNHAKNLWTTKQNQQEANEHLQTNDHEQANDPITERNQQFQNNEEIPDFSCITKSKESFQQLLNKTIEQHQQLKQLFQLFKISSQERVKELQQNFKGQLDEMQEKFKKQKQYLQKYAKKAKQYKKEIKQKESIILDLIQKLRFYVQENERIKKGQRKKVLLEVLSILKQKQLAKMMKSTNQKDNVKEGRNIILAAIQILSQCRIERKVLKAKQENQI